MQLAANNKNKTAMTTTNNVAVIRAFTEICTRLVHCKNSKTRQALFFVGRLSLSRVFPSAPPLLFHPPAPLHADHLPLVPAAAPM